MVEEPEAGPCLKLLTTPDLVNRVLSNPSAHKHLQIIYLKYVQNEYWRIFKIGRVIAIFPSETKFSR